MGYEAAGKNIGKNIDDLLEQLDKETLSKRAKDLKKKVEDAVP
jgi:hypothetical protein